MTSSHQRLNQQHYTPEQLKAVLPSWISDVNVVEHIESTNTALKQMSPRNTTCLVAFHQTQGRGTLDRSFYCAPYQGIYVSFTVTHSTAFPVSLIIAAAITRSLNGFGYDSSIKWVNDIMIQNKKVGGILCEAYAFGTIIGFGLNVSVDSFPSELHHKAGSLHNFNQQVPSHLELIQSIFEHFTILMNHPRLTQTWVNQHLMYNNKRVRLLHQGKQIEGTCQGVNELGYLLINSKDRLHTFNTTVESMTLIHE